MGGEPQRLPSAPPLGAPCRHPTSNKKLTEIEQNTQCLKKLHPDPQMTSRGSQNGSQVHSKPPKLKSGPGLARASAKEHANNKSVQYLLCFNHIQAIPKTSPFVLFESQTALGAFPERDSNFCIKNIRKRAPQGPGWSPRWSQSALTSHMFLVRSFSAAISGPKGAWRGVPDPNGPQNVSKTKLKIMRESVTKL